MALSLVLHWTASISSVYLSSCPARLAACGPVTRPCPCYRCAACRRWGDGCRSFSVERSRKCCISWPGDWRVNWWRGVEQNQGSTHTLPYCSWSTHTTCATGENEWQRRPPPFPQTLLIHGYFVLLNIVGCGKFCSSQHGPRLLFLCSVCPDLLMLALEKSDFCLCQFCLQLFPDIPEAVTCACLKTILR